MCMKARLSTLEPRALVDANDADSLIQAAKRVRSWGLGFTCDEVGRRRWVWLDRCGWNPKLAYIMS